MSMSVKAEQNEIYPWMKNDHSFFKNTLAPRLCDSLVPKKPARTRPLTCAVQCSCQLFLLLCLRKRLIDNKWSTTEWNVVMENRR